MCARVGGSRDEGRGLEAPGGIVGRGQRVEEKGRLMLHCLQ